MHQRSVSAVILLLALITSVAANVLATAFCPRLGRPHTVCTAMVDASTESHSGMTHEMHGTEVSTAHEHAIHNPPTAELYVAGERTEEITQRLYGCSHCVSRGNLPQRTLALRQGSTSQCTSHVDAPEAIKTGPYLGFVPRFVNAREHAPPGQSSPLHVRLNVFRI
jgi:hypothetical protein